jgi:hypothetical protein
MPAKNGLDDGSADRHWHSHLLFFPSRPRLSPTIRTQSAVITTGIMVARTLMTSRQAGEHWLADIRGSNELIIPRRYPVARALTRQSHVAGRNATLDHRQAPKSLLMMVQGLCTVLQWRIPRRLASLARMGK